jgi:hypothetical protein
MDDMVVENVATPLSVDDNIADWEKLLIMEGDNTASGTGLMLKVPLDSIDMPMMFGTPSRPLFVCQNTNFPERPVSS